VRPLSSQTAVVWCRATIAASAERVARCDRARAARRHEAGDEDRAEQQDRDAGERHRIGGGNAVKLAADDARGRERERDAGGDAGGADRKAASEHEPRDLPARRAERLAQREFVPSLADRECHQSVKSADREHERDRREGAEQDEAELAIGERARSQLGQGRERMRDVRGLRIDDPAQRRRDRRQRKARSHDETEFRSGERTLREIHVDRARRCVIEAPLADVADDADDRQHVRVAVHVAVLDALADRVGLTPARARGRGADDGHLITVAAIAIVERATCEELDAGGLEIIGRGDAEFCVADRRRRMHRVGDAAVPERAVRAVAAERQRIDAADGRDAGNGAQCIDQRFVATRGFGRCGAIVRPWARQRHAHRAVGVESGVHREQREETSSEKTRADEQHGRKRGLADQQREAKAKMRTARRLAAPAFAKLADRRAPTLAPEDRGSRRDRDRERGEDRDDCSARSDRDLGGAWKVSAAALREHADCGHRQRAAEDRGGHGDQCALGEDLARDVAAARTERGAHRELARAGAVQREQEIRGVRDRDQQQEKRSAGEQQQRAPDRSRDRFGERRHVERAGVGLAAELTAKPCRERVRGESCGRKCVGVAQARDDRPVVRRARRAGIIDERRPRRAVAGECEPGRHDADDRRLLSADADRAAEHVGSAVQEPLPESMRDHDDFFAFARIERAAKLWRDAEHAEEIAAGERAIGARRRVAARDRAVAAAVIRARLDRIDVRDEVGVVRIRDVHRVAVIGELADLHETIGPGIAQVAQQHRIDDRVDRERGTEAEPERHGREERGTEMRAQAARCEGEVLKDVHAAVPFERWGMIAAGRAQTRSAGRIALSIGTLLMGYSCRNAIIGAVPAASRAGR
jgi:hypothetical protein